MSVLTLLQEETRAVTVKIGSIITLENSGITGGDFAMRELDEQHVQDLVNSDRNKWPAIKIAATSIGPILTDGYHRLEAAIRQGATALDAILQSYETENDIIEAAFRANLSHGLKASQETRGDYAYWLHISYPDMSQQEIAARAQITQSVVSKAIAKREALLRDKELEDMGVKEEFDAQQSWKKFSKRILRFYTEVSAMNDTELIQIIQSSVKPSEREKLVHIAKLLVLAYGGK
jgi:ParB-like chromosome segregation protein Spo0J